MIDLIRGRTPDTFLLLRKDSIRLHHYTRESIETLATRIGEMRTVVYRSVAEGSERANRYWCAPDHGYIPMHVQQKNKDSIEWTMDLESFKRAAPLPSDAVAGDDP
jgi:hypothetical protein